MTTIGDRQPALRRLAATRCDVCGDKDPSIRRRGDWPNLTAETAGWITTLCLRCAARLSHGQRPG